MATVLQMQYINNTTVQNVVVPAATWTNIPGVAVTITPTSAVSSIEVQASIQMASNNLPLMLYRFTRNGTPICVGAGPGTPGNGRFLNVLNFYMLNIDNPASVAALTYQLQMYSASGTTFTVNSDTGSTYSGVSTIVVKEIG